MKIFITIFSLLPSILINAQVIDWNNFNEKTMNELMFRKMKEYTLLEGGYSLSHSSSENQNIYNCIKRNNEELGLDDLSSEINRIIPVSSVGILDSISIKDIKTYQEIAAKCIADCANSPSDAFFMIGWEKTVDVTSLYNNRTGVLYISLVFKPN